MTTPISLSKMPGTTSKLIIRRYLKKDIHLWIPYDGQWELVGNQLCAQIKNTLYKYTPEHLQKMVERINIKDRHASDRDALAFRVEDFGWFVEGLTSYKHDDCDDYEYLYTLDLYSKIFTGEHINHDDVRAIPFDLLCDYGKKMTSFPNY